MFGRDGRLSSFSCAVEPEDGDACGNEAGGEPSHGGRTGAVYTALSRPSGLSWSPPRQASRCPRPMTPRFFIAVSTIWLALAGAAPAQSRTFDERAGRKYDTPSAWHLEPHVAESLFALATQAPPDRTSAGRFVVEHPTLHNLGFEWAIDGDANRNATVDVAFRAVGDHAWRHALPLVRIGGEQVYRRRENLDYTVPDGFAGSILNLAARHRVRVPLQAHRS